MLYCPDVCNCTMPYVPRTVPAYAVRDPAFTAEVFALTLVEIDVSREHSVLVWFGSVCWCLLEDDPALPHPQHTLGYTLDVLPRTRVPQVYTLVSVYIVQCTYTVQHGVLLRRKVHTVDCIVFRY